MLFTILCIIEVKKYEITVITNPAMTEKKYKIANNLRSLSLYTMYALFIYIMYIDLHMYIYHRTE